MMELPPRLANWAPELALFPLDVAATLGQWLPRIDAAVGPLRHVDIDEGDPDGFDGLTRRGSYERLLVSEWLLADEVPDEFIRRAASGEHGFLRFGHRSPASAARCVALFDAGWQQLGAPRLAHLALLVVLARRALTADVDFAWGILQAPRALHEGLTKPGIRALIDGRTGASATLEQLDAWWEVARPQADDDLWLIGGAELGALASARDVACIEVGEAAQRRLHVDVRGRRQLARRALLEIPADADAVRVFRHPFDVPAEAPAPTGRNPRFEPGTALAIAASPRRLIGRGPDGALIAAHIPTSPMDKPGRSRRFVTQNDEAVVGVGYMRKNIVVATLRGDAIALYVRRHEYPTIVYLPEEDRPRFTTRPSEAGLVPLRIHHTWGRHAAFALIDGAENLFLLPSPPQARQQRYDHQRAGVVALKPDGIGYALVRDDAGSFQVVELPEHARAVSGSKPLPQEGWRGRAMFGASKHEDRYALAVDYGTDWMLATQGMTFEIPAPAGRVLGVTSATRLGLGLIALEPSRDELVHIGPGGTHTLTRLDGPATSAVMGGSLVAWIDAGGVPRAWCCTQGSGMLNIPRKVIR